MTWKKNSPAPAQNEHLVKSSSSSQIQSYFAKILELKTSGKEFPVNLDDVWALAYSRKEEAVRELKSSFIEDEDYIFRKNAEKLKTKQLGRAKIDYYLSVSCLEYFIAKRVKPVFEVYRQVFHKTNEKGVPRISQQAIINDGEVFATKLGKQGTHSVYINGELFSRFATIATYLGYSSVGKAMRDKVSVGNILFLTVGKTQAYFVNYRGFNEFLNHIKLDVPFEKIRQVKMDVFADSVSDASVEKIYKFTQTEIMEIISLVNSVPIKKTAVIDALIKGGKDA